MANILIIDDNYDFRKLFREVLEKSGYDVYEAANGEEGIKVYNENQIDLVITDMIMPKKEGLETMIELRQADPDIKIIAMSGDGFEAPLNYLDGAKLLGGATKAFVKPFSMEEMLSAIKQIIEGKSQEGEK